MNKQQYQQGYRLTRLINQLSFYPDRTDRIGKKCIRDEMKAIGLNHIDTAWLQTNYMNGFDSCLITAYSEKIYGYNSEHTPVNNRKINNKLFFRRLQEIYRNSYQFRKG